MNPKTNKVSSCCGDRLIPVDDTEGTGHYECFACGKPCDGVQNCADCFPIHWQFQQSETVPLCEKHYQSQAKNITLKPSLQNLRKEFENEYHKFVCNCNDKKCPRVDIISDWWISKIKAFDTSRLEEFIKIKRWTMTSSYGLESNEKREIVPIKREDGLYLKEEDIKKLFIHD